MKFGELYRNLRRMNIQEIRHLERLESDVNESLQCRLRGMMYRKVLKHLAPAAPSEHNIEDREKRKEKDGTEEEVKDEQVKANGQGMQEQIEKDTSQHGFEYHWVDEDGWPVVEDVFIGTDMMAEWEVWRKEFQRREAEEMEKGGSCLGFSELLGSAAAAESASASADSSPFIKRRANGLRGFSGDNGFGQWNRYGHQMSASLDSINLLGRHDNFIGRSSLSGSFGDGGVHAESSDGRRPRFMSRHAAKMRKRYPSLAEYTPIPFVYCQSV